MPFFVETAWIARRNLIKLRRNPLFLFFSLLLPLLFFVMFTQTFANLVTLPAFAADPLYRDVDYVAIFLPAVLIMSAIQSAAQSGLGIMMDIESGFHDKFLVAPIHRASVLAGKLLSDGLRMTVQAGFLLLVAWLLALALGWRIPFASGLGGMALVALLAGLFGVAMSGLSNVIALRTRSTETTMMASFGLTFPLLFLSTAMLPKPVLPQWVQDFSAINPVTYVADAVRALVLAGIDWTDVAEAIVATAILGIVLHAAAAGVFRREGA